MTISQVDDKYIPTGETSDWIITCDRKGCKATLDAKDRTFGQTVQYAKANKWSVNFTHGSYIHRCPDCNLATSGTVR